MPLLDAELDTAIALCIEQWNIAEQRIKKAELVRGNEVVASAIFELRYAGRKIVDALFLCLSNDLKEPKIRAKVLAYIADATEDCVKAKHDAIDSMLDFVTIWFKEVEENLSLAKVLSFFPDYLSVTSLIYDLQDKIAESRKNRTNSRDDIYNEIERDSYDRILELFDRMRRSREKVAADIRKDNWKDICRDVATYGGFALAILGIALALYFYYNPIEPPPAAASSPSTGSTVDAPARRS